MGHVDMSQKRRIPPLTQWWRESSDLFKLMIASLCFAFSVGVFYSTMITKVEANETRIDSLEDKQVIDHETLVRIDQNVMDLKEGLGIVGSKHAYSH